MVSGPPSITVVGRGRARPAAWCGVLLLLGGLAMAEEGGVIHDPPGTLLPPPVPVSAEQQAELQEILGQGRQAYAVGNYPAARHWLWIAAEQGNAESQFLLAALYRRGLGGDRDPGMAAKWLRQAALQGHAGAQNDLGEAFRDAQGVENDDTEAAWWFRRAAEQGQADGQANLGELTLLGRGVSQDDGDAVQWFQQAAEQGQAAAQYWLGFCYAEGRGLVADSVVARRWLDKSAAAGHSPARDYLRALDSADGKPPVMTPRPSPAPATKPSGK